MSYDSEPVLNPPDEPHIEILAHEIIKTQYRGNDKYVEILIRYDYGPHKKADQEFIAEGCLLDEKEGETKLIKNFVESAETAEEIVEKLKDFPYIEGDNWDGIFKAAKNFEPDEDIEPGDRSPELDF